jgi:threonylcarbamoyladenosine tRNA methylthiotransferase MtaB
LKVWQENTKNSKEAQIAVKNNFPGKSDNIPEIQIMKKVAITTLGCKTNQFESAAIIESIGKKGYSVVPFADFADVYIINTCTVTAKSDAESRRLIRRARNRNASARIVVTGCYAQLAHEEIRNMPGVSIVLGNNEKRDLADLLEKIDSGPVVMVSDISEKRPADGVVLETFAEHTRAFLQVQNGCDAFCSYCIVPYVRGRSRSVELEDAVEGIRSFVEKGFKEVVLTGIHLGMYGIDLEPPKSMLDLLSAAEQRTGLARLRTGSLEPAEITDHLVEFISSSKIICPHLHVPLQSGDDRVLSRMNRHYTTRFYSDVIGKLTAAIPGVCLGTDIIAGFPGESEQEFENTQKFLEALPLAYFHVFPFSPREQTPAAGMGGRVPSGVVRERAKILRTLSEAKKDAYYKSFLGKELDVLVQSREQDGSFRGLSRNYIPVEFSGKGCSENSEVKVMIKGIGQGKVTGDLAD